MFKVKNKNTRTAFLTYFTPFSVVSIVDFEQVNVSWVIQKALLQWVLLQIKNYLKKDVNHHDILFNFEAGVVGADQQQLLQTDV